MSSILSSLQQEIADCLNADPFFATVPVLVEQPHDPAFHLAEAIASAGVWGVVRVPQAQVTAPGAPGPVFDPAEFAVRFHENTPVDLGPGALETAETALALLHLYRPATANEVFSAAPTALVRLNDPDVVGYEIRVRIQAGCAYAVPQLAAPTCSPGVLISPLTVTLSGPAGTAIFYTLDGTAPVPRGSTASLYQAPIALAAPGHLRARAWLAGYLASPELQLPIS